MEIEDYGTIKMEYCNKTPAKAEENDMTNEKQLQRALLQWSRPQNADLVREALIRADRRDLFGSGEKCLVRPKFNPAQNRGRTPRSNPGKGGKRKP